MNLKQKLQYHRYGERKIRVPDHITTKEYMNPVERIRRPVGDLSSKVMYALLFPPKRDRYYPFYKEIPYKYSNIMHDMSSKAAKQAMAHLINHSLCGKLAYMLDHPAQFGEFKDFKYAWLSNALFAMRNTILKQDYLADRIGTTRSSSIQAIIHLPYPKPMGLDAMGLLADQLFELVYTRTMYLQNIRS